jgi:hypothetical protein
MAGKHRVSQPAAGFYDADIDRNGREQILERLGFESSGLGAVLRLLQLGEAGSECLTRVKQLSCSSARLRVQFRLFHSKPPLGYRRRGHSALGRGRWCRCRCPRRRHVSSGS